MTAAFTPITITGFNDRTARTCVVLDLSGQVPLEWANYFHQRWNQHFYMMKRSARVGGKLLEIDCVMEELEKIHIPELRKVFEETNSDYSKLCAISLAGHQEDQAKRDADAAKLVDLKKSIKFE